MANANTQRKLQLFDILYKECRRDPDMIAMIVDEFLNTIDDCKLSELEDFIADNLRA